MYLERVYAREVTLQCCAVFEKSGKICFQPYRATEKQRKALDAQLKGFVTLVTERIDPKIAYVALKALRHLFNRWKGDVVYKFGVPLFKQANILEAVVNLKKIILSNAPQDSFNLTKDGEAEGVNAATVFHHINEALCAGLNELRVKKGMAKKNYPCPFGSRDKDESLSNFPFFLAELQKRVCAEHPEQLTYSKGYSCRSALRAFKIVESLCTGDDAAYREEMNDQNVIRRQLRYPVRQELEVIRTAILASLDKEGSYDQNPLIAALRKSAQTECKKLEKQLNAIEAHCLTSGYFYKMPQVRASAGY